MRLIFRLCTFLLAVGLVTQGFQCSSAEMTKGNIKYNQARQSQKQSDWEEARVAYEAELSKRPTNGEAWFRLVDVRKNLGDFPGMIEAMDKADQYLKDKSQRTILKQLRYNGWVDAYNKGFEYVDSTKESSTMKEKKLFVDRGDKILDLALGLKPENPEPYLIKSYLYDEIKDTVRYIEVLETYTAEIKAATDLMANKNLRIRAERASALERLGQPDSSSGFKYGRKDSVVFDTYSNLDGNRVKAFYRSTDDGPFELRGLRINLPQSWIEAEQNRYSDLDAAIFPILAYNFYYVNDYDKANKYLRTALQLDPADENALRLQSAIIEETGSADDALNALKDLVDKFPDDKSYLGQYGSLLANSERYDEAIIYFEKALDIDSDFDIALYNVGAALKNRAGIVQKEERDKADADKEYEIKNERYFPDLRKSAAYFERYRALPGKDRDFQVLEQLINIYQVIEEEEKTKKLVAELESLRYKYKDNAGYFEFLGTYYAKSGQTEKAEKAFAEADAIRER